MCPHGRPLWCSRRHHESDPTLGTPLCADCYDYTGHVVWQWHAPELWRRFTIALQRDLARRCGLSVTIFRARCKISYSKVVEFQARGIIHVHVPVRLDDPNGADGGPPDLPLTTSDLEDAIRVAARHVRLDAAPLVDGTVYRLHWGEQVDTRTISEGEDRGSHSAMTVHPEQVAAYIAKYVTKATEDFGLPAKVVSAAHASAAGASAHAVRIIQAAERVAGQHDDYAMLLAHLATLGHRGHPMTKSRSYSVTFGQLRRARRRWRRNPAGLKEMTSMRKDRAAEDEPMPERLWTIKDTSDFLGVPVATLYYWHSRGEGPRPFKVGRHLRYDPRTVMRWVESSAA